MRGYAIGVDFGSLSARAVVTDVESGEIVGSAVSEYRHGIMTECLPNGTVLGANWAVQLPQDYLDSLSESVKGAVADSGVDKNEIIGIGLDVTASTILPTDENGLPMCESEKYIREPNAYIKVWKHHAAQSYADLLERAAEQNGDRTIAELFGGHVSGEHFLPKAAQIFVEAPELFEDCGRIIEVGDWLVRRLCGVDCRGYCAAAFKTYYSGQTGDLPDELLNSVLPGFCRIKSKIPERVEFTGDCVGGLNEDGAALLGLPEGIAVSAAGVDAHSTVYGCGVSEAGQLLLIVGTSTCAMLQSETQSAVDGISGVVGNSVFKGLYTYECGQSGVGDIFAWFADSSVDIRYHDEAAERSISLQELLTEKASRLRVGENGMVALDWWNGVRSTLMDFSLSGVIAGLTTDSKPEEIYRALLEATAFGCRKIVETLERGGVEVNTVFAAGGIPLKNPLMMQIYADVLNRDVYIVGREQTGAVGSAVTAAAAAGGGFSELAELTKRYAVPCKTVYHPDGEAVKAYNDLYEIYGEMYNHFGQKNGLLGKLNDIRRQARS